MSQAFQTTYKRYYRKHEISVPHSCEPHDKFTESLPESGNWMIINSLEEQKKSGLQLTEVEEAVKEMYRKRYWSTYQMAYCPELIPKEEFIQETSENELLWSANELYKYKDGPVLPVRPTTRRVFGYLRPSYTYTPLTTYQLVHGKMAYQVLKDGFPKNLALKKGFATDSAPVSQDENNGVAAELHKTISNTDIRNNKTNKKMKNQAGHYKLLKTSGCICICTE